jgi:hypothetical protein
MATLPIMLFDERQLAPSFGYLFNPKWVSPHESIVSMQWKFGRANALPGHVLITQIAKDTIDPYEGISACPSAQGPTRTRRTVAHGASLADSTTAAKDRQSMVPVLQIMPGWWLQWRRPPAEQGKALPGSWNAAGGKMRTLWFPDAVLAECAVVRRSLQMLRLSPAVCFLPAIPVAKGPHAETGAD